ncbi:MAG: hypothetical protein P9L99_16095 [Candidatus Lernaella stagnicola]|nr:hypothetical protein [Candidatus Lernaella stagnicola]
MPNFVHSVIAYMSRHQRRVFPLMRRMFGEGFRFEAACPDGTMILEDYMDEMRDEPRAHADRLLGYAAACEGGLTLYFEDVVIARLLYDDGWHARVILDFLHEDDFDLMELHRRLEPAVEYEDIIEIIDLCIAYLGGLSDEAFGYTVETAEGPLLEAASRDDRLEIRLLDLKAWFRVILFLLKRSDPGMLVRNPLDMMKAVEQAQETLSFMADRYEENDRTLVIRIDRSRLFSCGKGIRPNLGSRFGSTALHLDVLTRAMKTAFSGRNS